MMYSLSRQIKRWPQFSGLKVQLRHQTLLQSIETGLYLRKHWVIGVETFHYMNN